MTNSGERKGPLSVFGEAWGHFCCQRHSTRADVLERLERYELAPLWLQTMHRPALGPSAGPSPLKRSSRVHNQGRGPGAVFQLS